MKRLIKTVSWRGRRGSGKQRKVKECEFKWTHEVSDRTMNVMEVKGWFCWKKETECFPH